jgi:trk system potassium uptake protein TrkH
MLNIKKIFPPISLPIVFFGLMSILGALLLHSEYSLGGKSISWTDAFFTSTSAVCVTGLTVVDTGSYFNAFGQGVILLLIQLGGLGIMTFASLAFFLWRRRISLTDKIAVGQSILHDRTFHLGSFLLRMILLTLVLEGMGAILIFLLAPGAITPFSALFHAVSAFCNAGFSLYSDSLVAWRGLWGINLVIMFLIIAGGLGFSVLVELQSAVGRKLHSGSKVRNASDLSWYATTIIKTSFMLIMLGWAAIYLAEYIGFQRYMPFPESVLSALFQSVTCRTAGFNTLDIGGMTNVSLLVMVVLMFIGGAPGSCAGGIKVSTFRVFCAFVVSQFRGDDQVVIRKFAIDPKDLGRALILIIFSVAVVFSATMVLTATEGGAIPHPQTRGQFMEILFEVVSAIGTVGLSTGLTPKLSLAGKWIVTLLMFIGRLGPLVFLAVLRDLHREKLYRKPEENILIG